MYLLLQNSHLIVVAVVAAGGLISGACLLARARQLITSPVALLLVAPPLYIAVTAYAFGELRPLYADDPWALSWLEHLSVKLGGAVDLAAIVYVTSRYLPDGVKRRRKLFAVVRSAPWVIMAGYAMATLVLLSRPPLVDVIGADLSPEAFLHRAFLLLPPAFYGLVSFVVWLLAYREFGEPRSESEAARKRRFVPLASGGIGWTLLYLLHFAVPLAALLWPNTPLGRDPKSYTETIMLPIFVLLSGSYLLVLVGPYRPSNLYLRMRRFTRYNRLTQNLSFRIKGHVGPHWMIRYKYARARRFIELACRELGLPPQTSARAATTYAIAAVTRAGIEPGVRTLPPYDSPMDRSRLRELYDLHNEFLREPEGSPRRAKALENTYAPLVPNALLLSDETSAPELRDHPADVQLAAIAAADFGVLPSEESTKVLDGSSPSVQERLLKAYTRAANRSGGRAAS